MQKHLLLISRKPKKKYANQEQKHHYVEAVKHYRSYKNAMKSRDEHKAELHAQAVRDHIASGKLTNWHRDQMQHDSRYSKEASGHNFTPYKKIPRSKRLKKGLLGDYRKFHEDRIDHHLSKLKNAKVGSPEHWYAHDMVKHHRRMLSRIGVNKLKKSILLKAKKPSMMERYRHHRRLTVEHFKKHVKDPHNKEHMKNAKHHSKKAQQIWDKLNSMTPARVVVKKVTRKLRKP